MESRIFSGKIIPRLVMIRKERTSVVAGRRPIKLHSSLRVHLRVVGFGNTIFLIIRGY